MAHVLSTTRITVDLARPEEFGRVGEIGVAAYRAVQDLTDDYAAALRDAVAAGVEVLAYGVELSPVELRVGARLPVLL